MTIQFGLCLPLGAARPAQRAGFVAGIHRALELAAGHFDGAWSVDHLQFDQDDMLEGFTTVSYLAGRHPQLKFGHTVLCQSFRNPALLAKMAATLQFLSGGRFTLGLGAGWHAAEYKAYGYDFPPNRVRVEQLDEALQIIRALWTQPQATFVGKHYRVIDAICEPRPDPLPRLMLGAFRPKVLRLAARYADDWNVASTGLDEYRALAKDFERACAEVDRDPATITRSWGGGCACAPTEAEAVRFAAGRFSASGPEDFGFVGTPRQVIEQMRPFVDAGIEHFVVDCCGFPKLTTLELLVGEVLPTLKG